MRLLTWGGGMKLFGQIWMRISDAQASLAVTPAGRSDKRFIFLEWSNSAKKLGGDWGVGGLD